MCVCTPWPNSNLIEQGSRVENTPERLEVSRDCRGCKKTRDFGVLTRGTEGVELILNI